MKIFIFKTNIERTDLPRIKQTFDKLPFIQKWTIDFDDCDRVLRIESASDNLLPDVINKVEGLGLVCADLNY